MKITKLITIIFCLAPSLWAQWSKVPTPFQPIAISRSGDLLWIAGANASIASSENGGNQWVIKTSREGGNTLLCFRWNSDKVGAAGGAEGLILLSTDGGAKWGQIPTPFTEPVLDLSFSDSEHGIVLTTAAVLFTKDGGKTWDPVLPSTSPDLSRFKFVLAVANLDDKHAVALVKEGPAQYYDGRLVSTGDGGATWKTINIEHTTLNNLLVSGGQLWLVGTEVIDRDKRGGGGHAVPVTFHSSDATTWERGPKPLIDTNDACRPEGCLMWNGAWFDPFVPNGAIHAFPPTPDLSVQWASTDKRICTLAPDLECSESHVEQTLPQRGGPAPQLGATELRPTSGDVAGKCIRCDFSRVLINDHFAGRATVKLTILARPDGTVSSVEVVNTPDPEVGAALSKAATKWMFYPVLRNGVPVPTKRTLDLSVAVIKPR